jgi:hypothetical protein
LKTWAFVQVFPFQSLAWLTEPLFFNLLRLSLHPWFTVFPPSAAKIREILSRLSEEDEQLVWSSPDKMDRWSAEGWYLV